MSRSLLVIGMSGMIGSAVRDAADTAGWATTGATRSPAPRSCQVRNDKDLAELVASRPWTAVVDLRASDAASARVVLTALPSTSRIILLSSIYAYGHPRHDMGRSLECLNESEVSAPVGPYGTGKLAAESELETSPAREIGVVARLPFVIGPGDRTGRLAAFCAHAARRTESAAPSSVIGLTSSRTAADRIVQLLTATEVTGLVNIDAGTSWRLEEHLAAARRITQIPLATAQMGDIPFDVGRSFSLDSDRLHSSLGVEPETNLDAEWARISGARS